MNERLFIGWCAGIIFMVLIFSVAPTKQEKQMSACENAGGFAIILKTNAKLPLCFDESGNEIQSYLK